MKILLIQPPVQDFYQTSIRTQPLGLAYLAASLQSNGHEAEILDCQRDRKRSIPVRPELSYLRDFYPFDDRSSFKLYSGYYHFGMSWDEIRREIEGSEADLFGISSSFTPYHQEALEVARIIKQWDRGKIVIMGGAHVSCDPEGTLSSAFVDYIVLGEGEIRFPLLVEAIQRGDKARIEEIDGVGFRKNGKVILHPLRGFIQDLDSLPPPARGLLELNRYRLKRRRSTMIITSRGCPHRCAYCSGHLVTGTSFRIRSPENILKEMEDCRDRYGIEIFDIEDDNFTFDKDRAKKLMGLIVETFGERKLEMTAMNGVSFASLDGELLGLMKKAGFDTINLSLVSTDIGLKKRMGRPSASIDFDELLKKAEDIGLDVIAYAILGMPGQTIEEMVDTLVHLMGKRVLIGPSIYYPTPGTPLFDICKEADILPPHRAQWRSSAFPIETGDFNRLDMVTLFRLTRVINFVKGKMDGGELQEGMTWKELCQFIGEKRMGEVEEEGEEGGKAKAKVEKKEKIEAEIEAELEGREQTGASSVMLAALCEKDRAWIDLLSLLFEKRSFFGLKTDRQGRMSFFELESSKRVLERFLEKSWESPILKSRNPGIGTLDFTLKTVLNEQL